MKGITPKLSEWTALMLKNKWLPLNAYRSLTADVKYRGTYGDVGTAGEGLADCVVVALNIFAGVESDIAITRDGETACVRVEST